MISSHTQLRLDWSLSYGFGALECHVLILRLFVGDRASVICRTRLLLCICLRQWLQFPSPSSVLFIWSTPHGCYRATITALIRIRSVFTASILFSWMVRAFVCLYIKPNTVDQSIMQTVRRRQNLFIISYMQYQEQGFISRKGPSVSSYE